jgi:hypothetical protein
MAFEWQYEKGFIFIIPTVALDFLERKIGMAFLCWAFVIEFKKRGKNER